MKNHRIYIIALLFVLSVTISAQTQNENNEFSIGAGAGLLSLSPVSGIFNGYALDFGIGYKYFFHQNWGVHVGAGAGLFDAKTSMGVNRLTPGLTDRNGLAFELHTVTNYIETHNVMFLNIPLMLQYQTLPKQRRSNRETRVRREGAYVAGGVKAIIPLQSRFESNNTSLRNLAYYPDLDNWAGTQRFAGLGVFDGKNLDGNFELETFFALALEAGMKWRLHRNRLLYAGVFLDYGLTSIAKENRTPFLNYVAIEHLTNFPILEFSNKMNVMTVGVKLRLAFFAGSSDVSCPNQ